MVAAYKQHVWIGTFDSEEQANEYWYPDQYLRAWEKELGLELSRCDLTAFYEQWQEATRNFALKDTPFYSLLRGLCKEIDGAFTYLEDVEFHYQEDNDFDQLLARIPANTAEIIAACKAVNETTANCFVSYGVDLMPHCVPENSKKMCYLGSFSHETPAYLNP